VATADVVAVAPVVADELDEDVEPSSQADSAATRAAAVTATAARRTRGLFRRSSPSFLVVMGTKGRKFA